MKERNVFPADREPNVTKCRVCGEPMETLWQPPLREGREGWWYLTCKNATCAMLENTLNDMNYEELDLTPYLGKAAR